MRRRRRKQPGARPDGIKNYLRRITPFALLCLPFWLALPFIVDPGRIASTLPGTVPLWKELLWLVFALLISFLSVACSDWENRRKAARATRR